MLRFGLENKPLDSINELANELLGAFVKAPKAIHLESRQIIFSFQIHEATAAANYLHLRLYIPSKSQHPEMYEIYHNVLAKLNSKGIEIDINAFKDFDYAAIPVKEAFKITEAIKDEIIEEAIDSELANELLGTFVKAPDPIVLTSRQIVFSFQRHQATETANYLHLRLYIPSESQYPEIHKAYKYVLDKLTTKGIKIAFNTFKDFDYAAISEEEAFKITKAIKDEIIKEHIAEMPKEDKINFVLQKIQKTKILFTFYYFHSNDIDLLSAWCENAGTQYDLELKRFVRKLKEIIDANHHKSRKLKEIIDANHHKSMQDYQIAIKKLCRRKHPNIDLLSRFFNNCPDILDFFYFEFSSPTSILETAAEAFAQWLSINNTVKKNGKNNNEVMSADEKANPREVKETPGDPRKSVSNSNSFQLPQEENNLREVKSIAQTTLQADLQSLKTAATSQEKDHPLRQPAIRLHTVLSNAKHKNAIHDKDKSAVQELVRAATQAVSNTANNRAKDYENYKSALNKVANTSSGKGPLSKAWIPVLMGFGLVLGGVVLIGISGATFAYTGGASAFLSFFGIKTGYDCLIAGSALIGSGLGLSLFSMPFLFKRTKIMEKAYEFHTTLRSLTYSRT